MILFRFFSISLALGIASGTGCCHKKHKNKEKK
jgi:hypothetical protein